MKRLNQIKLGALGILFIAALFNYRYMFDFTAVMFKTPIEDMMHGWVVPFVSATVLWTRRHQLAKAANNASWYGAACVAFFLVLAWFGGRGGQSRIEQLSFIGLVWALPFTFWGRDMERLMRFPAAYLLFTIPISSFLDFFTIHLRIFSTAMATGLLNGVGVMVQRSGTALFSRAPGAEFNVDVADPCSGIRSLFAMMALMAVYAFYTQRQTWKKWVLFACSVPIAMLSNMVRIMSICLVASWFGQKIATGFYHDYSGYVTFLVGVLLMLHVGELLKRLGRPQKPHTANPDAPTTNAQRPDAKMAPTLAIVASVVLASLVTFSVRLMLPPPAYDTPDFVAAALPVRVGEFTSDTPWFCHNPQCLAVAEERDLQTKEFDGTTAFACPQCAARMHTTSLGEATDLPQDTIIIKRNYRATDGLMYATSVVIGGRHRNSIHRAELCMPAQGFAMLDARRITLRLSNGRSLIVRKIDAQRTGGTNISLLYWFFSRERECCSHTERILLDVWDRSVHNRINRWVMLGINVSAGIETPESIERLEVFLSELIPQVVLSGR